MRVILCTNCKLSLIMDMSCVHSLCVERMSSQVKHVKSPTSRLPPCLHLTHVYTEQHATIHSRGENLGTRLYIPV